MVIPTVSKTKVAASKTTATASTLKKVTTAPTKSKLREVATPQSPSPASARSISISETGKSPLSRRSASVPPSMHGDPIREMANTTGEAFSAATQAFLNQQREFAQPVSSRATASLRTSPFRPTGRRHRRRCQPAVCAVDHVRNLWRCVAARRLCLRRQSSCHAVGTAAYRRLDNERAILRLAANHRSRGARARPATPQRQGAIRGREVPHSARAERDRRRA